MHGYILERAADCEEALLMLKDFVGKGWYIATFYIPVDWESIKKNQHPAGCCC